MLVEILGGALLGAALKKKRGTDKILTETQPKYGTRYAVLSEVKKGKGVGAVAVSFISTSKDEAVKWMENAAEALAASIGDAVVAIVDLSNSNQNPRFVAARRVENDDHEIVFVITNF